MSHPIAEAGKATRFPPGRSGNPKGRPSKKPLTIELRRLLQEPSDGSQHTNAHMVAWEMIQRAKAGDVPAARLIWEYIEGKPLQPLQFVREEIERIAEAEGLDPKAVLKEAERIAAGMA